MDAVHQLMTYMEIFAMEQVEAWQGRESRTRHRSQAAEKEKPEKLRMSRSTPSRKPWDSDASPNAPSERLEPIARRQAVHSLHPVPVPVVPGTTGPLYRLQHQHPASPARGRPRRLERRFDRDLELEERFDEYSVHRPRRKATWRAVNLCKANAQCLKKMVFYRWGLTCRHIGTSPLLRFAMTIFSCCNGFCIFEGAIFSVI